MPPGFFRDSTVNLCVPFRQFTNQRISLPQVSDADKVSALLQLVDLKYEVWDYEEFDKTQKEGVPHLELTLHKLKRSALEAYLIIFQKHISYIDTVTTEPVLLRQLFDTRLIAPIEGSFILMDLSFRHLKIYVFVDHKITYHRVVPLGLEVAILGLTRSYRHNHKDIIVTKENARDILTKTNLFDYENNKSDYPIDRFFFQCRPFFEKVVLECKKTIAFYNKRNSTADIQSVIVMGSFLTIQGIESYLHAELALNIDRLQYDPKISTHNNEKESRFDESVCLAIAAGLPQGAPQPFNMLPVEYVNFQKIKKWAPQTFGIGLLLFLCLSGLAISKNHQIKTLASQPLLNIDTQTTAVPELSIAPIDIENIIDIQKRLRTRRPIPSILYYFGENTHTGVMLSELTFTQKDIKIQGLRINSTADSQVLATTTELAQRFSLQEIQNKGESDVFEITGTYSE